ncbi:MAG: zinc metallopeptidase [Clostridiales bacterium]|nr:zinc metallopeptidase [Candidatus Crickella caballi]
MYYGYGGLYYLSMIVLLPAILFTFACQARIKAAYNKYSQIANSRGITGAEAALRMMQANGINVAINMINGQALQNYYDPRTKTLNLSQQVYNSCSIASVCIACHEVGHAIQDAQHYAPLAFRNGIVPVVNLAQTMSWPLIVFGMVMTTSSEYGSFLFNIGVICFLFVILFHLVTLPVEFNASNRALENLRELEMVNEDDYVGSRAVLRAAAMTYVAALATAVANLLRILIMAAGRRR